MHWFDIVLIIVLLLSGLWSFFRGFIRELVSLTGLVLASVLALRGYPQVAIWLEPIIATAGLRQAVGFAAIFLAVMIVAVCCGLLLRLLLKAIGLSLLDRCLGGVFGGAKVVLLASVAMIFLTKFAPPRATQLAQETLLAPYLFRTAAWLSTLLEQHDHTVQQLYKHIPLP
ncbi:MAG: CvpA family protein [Candidatus Tectimicrobiota bacterium]